MNVGEMIFEVGQKFVIPKRTWIWCITIQKNIKLDEDLVCSLDSWAHTKDVIFGHEYSISRYHGCLDITKHEFSVSIKHIYLIKIETKFDGFLFATEPIRI